MSIWAVTLGVAIIVVIVTRGSFFALARMQMRGLWLLIDAAALQIGVGLSAVSENRSSWRTCPKVNPCRNVPHVEGAITRWSSTLTQRDLGNRDLDDPGGAP